MMAVCDGIRESKTEAGVFHLKGVRQGAAASSFPFVPRRLWLFLLLSNPRPGEFPGYILIVNDRTDKTAYYGKLAPNPVFQQDAQPLALRARIRCTFPEAGRYSVQVWFFQEKGSDVVKGELPFSVLKEGE
jgi:hypothetical protein